MSRDAFEHLQVCEFDWFYYVLLIFTFFWYSIVFLQVSVNPMNSSFSEEVEKERMKNLQERNITTSIMISKNKAVNFAGEKIFLDQDKLEKSEKNISEHRQEKVRLNRRAISLAIDVSSITVPKNSAPTARCIIIVTLLLRLAGRKDEGK